MTRLKKMNYEEISLVFRLEHPSSPAAAEGSLEAASMYSSAAAEAQTSWTWTVFLLLPVG